MVKRKEMQSPSYFLFRTRLEIPGSDIHWEVSTIDVKKFMDHIPSPLKELSKKRHALNSCYETVVYQDLNQIKKNLETSKSSKKSKEFSDPFKDKKVFYYQPYETVEEAHFGHEEVVSGILSGHLFMDEQSQISDFLLNPDNGTGIEIKDWNFFPFNLDRTWEDDFNGD